MSMPHSIGFLSPFQGVCPTGGSFIILPSYRTVVKGFLALKSD
jgi:hypothetical protein